MLRTVRSLGTMLFIITAPCLHAQLKQGDSAGYYYAKERKSLHASPVQQKPIIDSGAALCIYRNRIIRVGSDEFKKLPLQKLDLYATIADESSRSGYKYVFFYREKKE